MRRIKRAKTPFGEVELDNEEIEFVENKTEVLRKKWEILASEPMLKEAAPPDSELEAPVSASKPSVKVSQPQENLHEEVGQFSTASDAKVTWADRYDAMSPSERKEHFWITKRLPRVPSNMRETLEGVSIAWRNLGHVLRRLLYMNDIKSSSKYNSIGEIIGAIRVLKLLPEEIGKTISSLQIIHTQLNLTAANPESESIQSFINALENITIVVERLTPGYEKFSELKR